MSYNNSNSNSDNNSNSDKNIRSQNRNVATIVPPAAPYPPMMATAITTTDTSNSAAASNSNIQRYPSAPFTTVRSSLTSSPQYRTSAIIATQPRQQQQQQQQQQNSTTSASTSSTEASNANASSSGFAIASNTSMRRGQKETESHYSKMSSNNNDNKNKNNNAYNMDRPATSSTERRTGGTTSATTNTTTTTTATSAGRNYASRVRFCQFNMVACINCKENTTSSTTTTTNNNNSNNHPNTTSNTSTTSSPRVGHRKLGPILLDLRQLVTHNNNSNKDASTSTNTITTRSSSSTATTEMTMRPMLFTTRIVARSRGNPSLGASVASSCLDVSDIIGNITNDYRPSPCATGLTTGALCIHTFTTTTAAAAAADNNESLQQQQQQQAAAVGDDDYYSAGPALSFNSSIEYFHTPRHHRPATAVAWRRHNSRHVAIGLVSSTSAAAAAAAQAAAGGGVASHHHIHTASSPATGLSSNQHHQVTGMNHRNSRLRSGPAIPGTGVGARSGAASTGAGTGGGGGGGDREFCCFLWDIEHQSTGGSSTTVGTKRTNSSPLFKLSHNAGVASLAWLLEGGQTLAVGGEQRNIQLYDLRVSGKSSATPPISAFGHNFGVHGIEVDPFRLHQFATFSRAAGEPVKIWDARRMDSVISEIKVGSMTFTTPSSYDTANNTAVGSYVSSMRWSAREAGVLSVAMGDVVLDYDTSSRPNLLRLNHAKGAILDLELYPGTFASETNSVSTHGSVNNTRQKVPSSTGETTRGAARSNDDNRLISELYPQRMLVVLADRSVQDMAKHTIAPLAISRRDGRVVHALGKDVFLGSALTGPSAMESLSIRPDEDISATMMRRARCLNTARYSMDTTSNIQVLTEEISLHRLSPDHDALLRLWTWIDRIEALCTTHNPEDLAGLDEGGMFWASKGFDETGVWKLLQMENEALDSSDKKLRSDSLACDLYDSPVRRYVDLMLFTDRCVAAFLVHIDTQNLTLFVCLIRAALTACGWSGRFDLSVVLGECESLGEFERSAALAVFHGNLGSAVDALQRGADVIHRHMVDKASQALPATASQYAETLQLVAMCLAGFGGVDSKSAASPVWRRACESLMRRPDLSGDNLRASRSAYLRALLSFLINISLEKGYYDVLDDGRLSLCDRVAFACRFLPRDQLRNYLMKRVASCQESGNIEGLVISGIEKEGIKIIQSYVDHTADVQTAALVTSRVILPNEWTSERRVCAEILDSYRMLLNSWQMWHSRAMFDVDRADLLRRIKVRQLDAQGGNVKALAFQSRRIQSRGRAGARQPDPDILPSVPAQLDARCTYCSSSLGLKRQDMHANQWLSKMKPVLSCCPSCQKPLPRCAICLLSLGCLNPYMELTRERERTRPSRGGSSLQAPDDLSSLANLPFAEWFTWCLTCKHGGHAHHLVGWFANHEVCPVSGCSCRCQFDGIQKLNRPSLTQPVAPSHSLESTETSLFAAQQ